MLRRRRRGGGGHGYMEQDHPPATGHRLRRREEEAPSHLPPPPPEQQPSVSLLDDVLFEILSRVPYRSVCRFRCVSKPWLTLCSDPDIRRRSLQTLSGFFYYGTGDPGDPCFHNLSVRGPPLVDPYLSFLRGSYERFIVDRICRSLLLCRCWRLGSQIDECDYVVCNPATEEWTVLPPIELLDHEDGHLFDLNHDEAAHYLGFDAAVPSRFVVFVVISSVDDDQFAKAVTYSSETGRWTYMQSQWFEDIAGDSECVFLNGNMHLSTYSSSIVTLEEGKAWREMMIDGMPDSLGDWASIGLSQGRLYAWRLDNLDDCQLSVWVLEDYISGQWTLKYTVNVLELFGRHCRRADDYYEMFAIHPDCNLIFISDGNKKTVSYDMDTRKVHVICTDGELLGCRPYIPCFVEWSSVGQ